MFFTSRQARSFFVAVAILLLSVAFAPPAAAQGAGDPALAPQSSRNAHLTPPEPYRLFPGMYFRDIYARYLLEHPATHDVPISDGNDAPSVADRVPILAGSHIVAFYGKPGSRSMGILGEYPKEKLATLLQGYAKLYDDANGDSGIVPAFYLIYGTCWPGGEIGTLKDEVVLDYIEYAASMGWLVFLDHQIGKYTVEESMAKLLPWLKYPNVHLALDPEWHTPEPMEAIGSVEADELNRAQEQMQAYMIGNGIRGVRMLVVHQFTEHMIGDRPRLRADFDRVLLVHTADGFGPPALKRYTYANNARAGNLPVKGFKLFFRARTPHAGWDDPLLTPPEVLALEPEPLLIMYQ
ncbi:MAG: hypothetical protein NT080_06230 [Spirochaetes bacterium]|nr:hypothetical protein [Spirochaetota bacterium]